MHAELSGSSVTTPKPLFRGPKPTQLPVLFAQPGLAVPHSSTLAAPRASLHASQARRTARRAAPPVSQRPPALTLPGAAAAAPQRRVPQGQRCLQRSALALRALGGAALGGHRRGRQRPRGVQRGQLRVGHARLPVGEGSERQVVVEERGAARFGAQRRQVLRCSAGSSPGEVGSARTPPCRAGRCCSK